jgi:hypothetical protein
LRAELQQHGQTLENVQQLFPAAESDIAVLWVQINQISIAIAKLQCRATLRLCEATKDCGMTQLKTTFAGGTYKGSPEVKKVRGVFLCCLLQQVMVSFLIFFFCFWWG